MNVNFLGSHSHISTLMYSSSAVVLYAVLSQSPAFYRRSFCLLFSARHTGL